MSKRPALDSDWTISLRNSQPKSRLLEIGSGGGVSTQLAGQKAFQGVVAGIDRSAIMVQAASQRNVKAIKVE